MKRYALIIVAVCSFLLLWAAQRFAPESSVKAQTGQSAATAAQPSVKPSDAGTAAGTQQPAVTAPGNLSLTCQGCHGAGKSLPYMGGSLFHTSQHGLYDQNVHAQAKGQGDKYNCKFLD